MGCQRLISLCFQVLGMQACFFLPSIFVLQEEPRLEFTDASACVVNTYKYYSEKYVDVTQPFESLP